MPATVFCWTAQTLQLPSIERDAPMRSGKTVSGVALIALSLSALLAAACSGPAQSQAAPAASASVTVYEGARLITGDGSPAIENSAFVVDNNRFTAVGQKGQVQVPDGA